MDYSKLNEKQFQAVSTINGPVLIIAGAGSGKTTTLISRVAYLIEHGINPNNILLLTFTNNAADEMKTRASKVLDDRCDKITACTYHSFCADVLRKYGKAIGLSNDFTIITPIEELEAYKLCKSKLGFCNMSTFPTVNEIYEIVSHCLNACIDINMSIYEKYQDDNNVEIAVQELVQQVFIYKEQNNLVSYDDLLIKMYELLQVEEVRSELEAHYRYVMVDEYQDTCKIQEKIVMLLTRDNKNLAVVGDDYQCWHKDSIVITKDCPKKISELSVGDKVQTIKRGKVCFSNVSNLTHHSGFITSITTESGKNIRVTREHKMFASSPDFNEGYYVCLMYREDKGFRLGIISHDNSEDIFISERPERLWHIHNCAKKSDADYLISFLSIKYQIPTFPLYRSEYIDTDIIFDEFKMNGFTYLEKANKHFDYPNYFSKTNASVTLQMDAGHKSNLVTYIDNGYETQSSFSNYKQAYEFAQKLTESIDGVFKEEFYFNHKTILNVVTASSLTVSMQIPIIENGKVVLEKIVSIQNETTPCEVYNVEIESTGILIADNIVSHNCIYTFRGADISNIIHFPDMVGTCKNVVIDTNYRSTKEILDVANTMMDTHADFGYKKIMKDAEKNGKKVKLIRPADVNQEAEAVFQEILKWQKKGKNLSEFAVLERNSNSSARLELLLTKNGIEFEKFGGMKFLEHQCVIDILSFFKVMTNQNDELSWFHLLDILPGIGEVYAHKVMNDLKINNIKDNPIWSKKNFYNDLLELTEFIQKISNNAGEFEFESIFDMTTTYYVNIIIRKIEKMVHRNIANKKLAIEKIKYEQEVIGFLKEIALKYNSIVEFLDSIVLDATPVVPNDGKVVISTIHSAKGMEWEHVSLLDVMDGLFPYFNNTTSEEDMEDLRCLYVALTRAKSEETIYAPMEALVNGRIFTKLSPFLQSSMDCGIIKTPMIPYKEKQKIYLRVSYQNKEIAKSYGAKWDKEEKCWYCYDTDKDYELMIKKFGRVR